ncbi:MAG: hypothetical protein HRT66_13810, partial [Flavobacteriaceae bacterium]|nr:hypothetical protein [Flavobacteriaceae bacterium]
SIKYTDVYIEAVKSPIYGSIGVSNPTETDSFALKVEVDSKREYSYKTNTLGFCSTMAMSNTGYGEVADDPIAHIKIIVVNMITSESVDITEQFKVKIYGKEYSLSELAIHHDEYQKESFFTYPIEGIQLPKHSKFIIERRRSFYR